MRIPTATLRFGNPQFHRQPCRKADGKGLRRPRSGPRSILFRAGKSEDIKPLLLAEGNETTHYSIVDREGKAVAVTCTLKASFGAGVVADRSGILLNNLMDDFTPMPGVTNYYGLVQGEANVIAPKKTPLSSRSPTSVSRDGKFFSAIGSPGGARIVTVTVAVIINVIDYGMDIQEAIDASIIHHQWKPDRVFMTPFAFSRHTSETAVGNWVHGGHRLRLAALGTGSRDSRRRREA